jgi:hypothetical protein
MLFAFFAVKGFSLLGTKELLTAKAKSAKNGRKVR